MLKFFRQKFIAILLILMSEPNFAQITLTQLDVHKIKCSLESIKSNERTSRLSDTIMPYSWRNGSGCSLALYQSEGSNGDLSGYVLGNNSYGETETAQMYSLSYYGYPNSGRITDILVWFGHKNVGLNGNLLGKVYTVSPTTGGPLSVLGTSNPVAMSGIDTSSSVIALTDFKFSTPVSVTDSFFAGVIFSSLEGDTVGIVSTAYPCADHPLDNWEGAGTNWLSTVSTLHPINEVQIDAAIFPVYEQTSGINDISDEFSEVMLMPNPALDQTTLIYSLKIASPVQIEIYDIEGHFIKSIKNYVMAGLNSQVIDTKNLSDGIYLVSIETNSSKFIRKLIVTK